MSPNYLRLFLSRFPCSWLRDRIGRNYCIFNFFGIPAIPENCRRSLNSKKIKEQKSAISCRKNYGAIAAALSLSLFIHSSFSSFSRESFVRCARKKKSQHFDENFEIRERCKGGQVLFPGFPFRIPKPCKGVHRVDLGESFPTTISLQNVASIQRKTSPEKFAGQ